MAQQVYVLRCHRYYGQTEGIFLKLEDIEKYLRAHPKQPSPREGMFSRKGDWGIFDHDEGHFVNYYFEVKRVPYLGTLDTQKTWVGLDSGYYALYYKGHSWGDGVCIAASDDELRLKKVGLEKLLKEVYPKEKKAKEILKNLEMMEEDEVEKLWEKRVIEDTFTTPCYIMEVGD